MDTETASRIIRRLDAHYHPSIALNYSNTWELLVAVMLSAQCTDKRVNMVTPSLFARMSKGSQDLKVKSQKELEEIKETATMPLVELEQFIRSTGFYRMKALHIQQSAKLLLDKFNGKVPQTMEELQELPGVARKTANVILSAAFNTVEGITVDTHVKRIAQRLRFVPVPPGVEYVRNASAEKIERELMKAIPRAYWKILPHALIMLGRDVCRAQNPRCKACIIRAYCPVARV